MTGPFLSFIRKPNPIYAAKWDGETETYLELVDFLSKEHICSWGARGNLLKVRHSDGKEVCITPGDYVVVSPDPEGNGLVSTLSAEAFNLEYTSKELS